MASSVQPRDSNAQHNVEQDIKLKPSEQKSLMWTILITFVVLTAAVASGSYNWLIIHAASMGALGGVTHEFAQSRGKILFFKKYDDGLYLGSIAGMILGLVAGLLVIQSYLSPYQSSLQAPNQTQTSTNRIPVDLRLSLEVFFAGLALKGVTEAASGNPTSSSGKTSGNLTSETEKKLTEG